MKKMITIIASVSFYSEVAKLRRALSDLGFQVHVPDVVLEMEQSNSFDTEKQRLRYENYSAQEKKRIVTHMFDRIAKSDGLLVVNKPKYGIRGYIGPNVLMELTIAVFLDKPVFLLESLDEKLAAYSEITALQPIVIENNLLKMEEYFKKRRQYE